MAEFCLDCWNKLNGTNYTERKYVMTKYLDLCEGCGKNKPVIIMERNSYYLYKLRYIILPFRILYKVIYFLLRLLLLPYLILMYIKSKNTPNS